MSEIKIPVSWIRDKGIYLLLADSHHFLGSMRGKGEFITSFAERENTGKQPVPDWVPVDFKFSNNTRTGIACEHEWNIIITNISSLHNIKTWKPNIEELYKIYTAEQEKKKLNEQGFEDVVRYGFDQTKPTNILDEVHKLHEKNSNIVLRICKFVVLNNLLLKNEEPIDCVIRELAEKHDIDLHDEPIVPDSTGYSVSSFDQDGFTLHKEGNKLKLTKDDIGKEFENKAGITFEVCLVGDHGAVLISQFGDYITCSLNGVISQDDDNLLVNRHEPRWWLKHLPNANLFKGKWIACDRLNRWIIFPHKPVIGSTGFYQGGSELVGIKMPLLKPKKCEWKLSEISIEELGKWQKENENA